MELLKGMFAVSIYFFGIVVVLCVSAVVIYATVEAIKRQDEKYKALDEEESDDWFE